MATLFLRKPLFYNQFRTLYRSSVAFNVPITYNSPKNSEKFEAVFPEVMDSLMSSSKLTQNFPEVGTWVKKLVHYTTIGGKRSKGLAVPFGYELMEDPKYFSEETLHKARFLGWCVKILQGYLIAIDDIIDSSTTRHGKPCWYLLPNIGTSAINDCVIIYHSLMEILEMNFKKESYYVDLVSRFNEESMYVALGQYLDHHVGYTKDKNNLHKFTMERFNAIVIQKNAHFSFSLPLRVALLLLKNGKEKDTTELSNICWELGILLQLQNDYKDVYLDEAVTGKAGTDIQEGKLTWLTITALERCNEAQRGIIKEYYGSKNPEHVKRIKQLFDELQIDKLYEKHEKSVYENLQHRIRALPTEGETRFFLEILEGVRQRVF